MGRYKYPAKEPERGAIVKEKKTIKKWNRIEEWIIENFMLKYIEDGDIFIDIGAGTGRLTKFILSRA